MKKNNKIKCCFLNTLLKYAGVILFCSFITYSYGQEGKADLERRKEYLERLLMFFKTDDGVRNNPRAIRVSPLDRDWTSWQKRTGELPPDFSQMPSVFSIPDVLVFKDGGENKPVKSKEDWEKQKTYLREQIQYWITGTIPPAPRNVKAEIVKEEVTDGVTKRDVLLSFGPEFKATLRVTLLIPPGKGPFPVFLTQHNHTPWGEAAVRRGYIACIYAGSDSQDDAGNWDKIYYPEYDFSLLMRRAWGAHRAIDYLYTLPEVDKEKIGIAGHSRNGKQSLMAAAFDERITACIPSSAGTGGEIPFRYTREEYTVETIKGLTGETTAWFHPRLRFFVGNEYKLPVDMNALFALVAPRHIMISTAFTEPYGNPWGAEKMYHSAKKVYDFLNAGDNLAIKQRLGGHSTLPFIIEEYLDFFDYAFDRTKQKPPVDLLWDYSFEKWKKRSGENINPFQFSEKQPEDFLRLKGKFIEPVDEWEIKKEEIVSNINWSLGEAPAKVKSVSSLKFSELNNRQNYLDDMIGRPEETEIMGRKVISGIGELGHGFFYFPKERIAKNEKVPAVIWLHDYSYSSGFQPTWPFISAFSIEEVVKQGYAVFAFDFIGMGTRIEEGTRFYQRHPNWSKMGNMVSDVQDAVTLLSNFDVVDRNQIVAAGYSIGGTVALYSAALDSRIAGAAAFGAFTPMRQVETEKGLPGLREYSRIHGLQPRLGFFDGHEKRLPFDFAEIISCIAPRKILLVSPKYDQDANLDDIEGSVSNVHNVYDFYNQKKNIDFIATGYYNQFTEHQFRVFLDWLRNRNQYPNELN